MAVVCEVEVFIGGENAREAGLRRLAGGVEVEGGAAVRAMERLWATWTVPRYR